MFYPVLSSTLTKLAVFFPLLLWPDTIGKFMQCIPITIILTLTGLLIMALVFIPTLGAIFGKPSITSKKEIIIPILIINEPNKKHSRVV
ncbi:hypothetical protein [Wolbachia endosymbiont of Tetranychus urticae]|uniref:hypothetical protein n=1 Tax=Wolbachia endosymbiont of Tetranychus urticae TaxID=169184 RepID=UPI00397E905A